MTPNKWEHDRMVELAEMVVEGRRQGRRRRLPTSTRASTSTAPSASPETSSTLQLMWLEEPIPPENIDAMARDHRARPRRPSAPARTSISATASASCSKSRPSTSSCPTFRNAAASASAARSRTWPSSTRSPSRRTMSAHPSAPWPRPMSAPRCPTSSSSSSTGSIATIGTITTDKRDIIKNGFITVTDAPGIGLPSTTTWPSRTNIRHHLVRLIARPSSPIVVTRP